MAVISTVCHRRQICTPSSSEGPKQVSGWSWVWKTNDWNIDPKSYHTSQCAAKPAWTRYNAPVFFFSQIRTSLADKTSSRKSNFFGVDGISKGNVVSTLLWTKYDAQVCTETSWSLIRSSRTLVFGESPLTNDLVFSNPPLIVLCIYLWPSFSAGTSDLFENLHWVELKKKTGVTERKSKVCLFRQVCRNLLLIPVPLFLQSSFLRFTPQLMNKDWTS